MTVWQKDFPSEMRYETKFFFVKILIPSIPAPIPLHLPALKILTPALPCTKNISLSTSFVNNHVKSSPIVISGIKKPSHRHFLALPCHLPKDLNLPFKLFQHSCMATLAFPVFFFSIVQRNNFSVAGLPCNIFFSSVCIIF